VLRPGYGVAGDRGVEADLGLVQPETALPNSLIFFHGPTQPGGADQPGQDEYLPLGHVAVVEGQLTCFEVGADQHVVPRACGGQPRPATPPVVLGAFPGGADLSARVPVNSGRTACAHVSVTPRASVR